MFSTLYCQDMCISPVNPFADTVVLYLKINMSTIDTMGAGYKNIEGGGYQGTLQLESDKKIVFKNLIGEQFY